MTYMICSIPSGNNIEMDSRNKHNSNVQYITLNPSNFQFFQFFSVLYQKSQIFSLLFHIFYNKKSNCNGKSNGKSSSNGHSCRELSWLQGLSRFFTFRQLGTPFHFTVQKLKFVLRVHAARRVLAIAVGPTLAPQEQVTVLLPHVVPRVVLQLLVDVAGRRDDVPFGGVHLVVVEVVPEHLHVLKGLGWSGKGANQDQQPGKDMPGDHFTIRASNNGAHVFAALIMSPRKSFHAEMSSNVFSWCISLITLSPPALSSSLNVQ